MDVFEFCRGIDLMEGAVALIHSLPVTETEYAQNRELCQRDYRAFCSRIKGKEGYRGWMLTYLCRFSCEVYEVYKERGIDEQIYWDTFRDIRHWCENCYVEYGEYGIDEYRWFWRLLELKLFKLGRLEFEIMQSEWDIDGTADGRSCHIEKGDPVINVHIPQGEPLSQERCEESFSQAFAWFGRDIPYVCHSWLLYPGLRELLKSDSNILRFQDNFAVFQCDFDEPEAEWRVFGKVRQNPEDYPENTSLQRAMKRYLLSGKKLGNGLGVYYSG